MVDGLAFWPLPVLVPLPLDSVVEEVLLARILWLLAPPAVGLTLVPEAGLPEPLLGLELPRVLGLIPLEERDPPSKKLWPLSIL